MKSLNELKRELASQNQRGITFIMAATLYWMSIGIAGVLLKPAQAFILSIWATGSLFPLSIIFAKLLRINIFFKNELTPLGIWANVFQLFFFPVLFVAAKESMQYPPIFMGVLAGAHFVFYHWLYQSRTYLVMAFLVSLSSYSLGYLFPDQTYLIVGFSNAGWLGLGVLLLSIENRMLSTVSVSQ
jgi:hypothetical protein